MRIATALFATVTGAALSLAVAGPASALGGESLQCHVAPNADLNYHSSCGPDRPASSNNVSFKVFGGSGTYSYAWTLAGAGGASRTGCTATSSTCNLTIPSSGDREITATVVITQAGSSATLTSTARIPASCGAFFC